MLPGAVGKIDQVNTPGEMIHFVINGYEGMMAVMDHVHPSKWAPLVWAKVSPKTISVESQGLILRFRSQMLLRILTMYGEQQSQSSTGEVWWVRLAVLSTQLR